MNSRLTICVLCWLAMQFALTSAEQPTNHPKAPTNGSVVLSPAQFGGGLQGHEGLVFVPENRAATNSRMIAVHFLRFTAREPKDLSPVFMLLGGPGDACSVDRINRGVRQRSFTRGRQVLELSKSRDVVIMNQRGNIDAPGMIAKGMVIMAKPDPTREPFSIKEASKRLRAGARESFDRWSKLGYDLAGYDIVNLVDDVDAIREAFDYQKICLWGGSFGSQSSIAYMKRYPQNVDRAVLSGVEPLDHGYDSPDGIWEALQRLEQLVKDDGKIELLEEGLLGAVKEIVERLENEPQVVRSRHPNRESWHDVTIGADDFRRRVYSTRAGRSLREQLEYWPKYILENYNGDYRFIAAQAIDDRPEFIRGKLQFALMDNSLGISAEREQQFNESPYLQWLGDINWRYVATRDVTPTPVIDDEYRKLAKIDVPVLMIHGDLDLSTPLSNATELLGYLPNGHLVMVKGGTHGAFAEIVATDKEFFNQVKQFMNADFDKVSPKDLFKSFPESVDLPPLEFKTGKASLFDALILGKGK